MARVQEKKLRGPVLQLFLGLHLVDAAVCHTQTHRETHTLRRTQTQTPHTCREGERGTDYRRVRGEREKERQHRQMYGRNGD